MPEKITQLQKELETIIKGKKAVTDKIIMAVLARGHILLEDVPGVRKDNDSTCPEPPDGNGI